MSFYEFILSDNIVKMATSFIIAQQVNMVCSSVLNNIISPVLNTVFHRLETKHIYIFKIRLKIGYLAQDLIRFSIVMYVIYLLLLLKKI